jgi:hypothetical protein
LAGRAGADELKVVEGRGIGLEIERLGAAELLDGAARGGTLDAEHIGEIGRLRRECHGRRKRGRLGFDRLRRIDLLGHGNSLIKPTNAAAAAM